MSAVEVVNCIMYTGTGVSGLEVELGQEFICVEIVRADNKYRAWKHCSDGAIRYQEYKTGTPNTIEWDDITPSSSITFGTTSITIDSTDVVLNENGEDYMVIVVPKK